MKTAVWLSGALLFLTAAVGVWFAAQSPAFVAGLAAVAAGAAWKALAPKVAQRMTPEEEAAWHAAERRGEGDEWLKHRKKRANSANR